MINWREIKHRDHPSSHPWLYLKNECPLQWRHNESDGVSNHWRLYCFLSRLFRRRSKKTSKLHGTGLCEGYPPVIGGFPSKGPVTRKLFPIDDVIMPLCTLMARCLQLRYISFLLQNNPDDVIKWKHFPGYWPVVQGIRGSPVNSPQRPVTRSFDVFFDLRLNKRLSKQSWGWWFSTPSRSLWRRCNVWAPWHFWFWTILNIIMRLDCNVDETATVYNFRLA